MNMPGIQKTIEPMLNYKLVRRINEAVFELNKMDFGTGLTKFSDKLSFKKSQFGYDAFCSDGKVLRFEPDLESNLATFTEYKDKNIKRVAKHVCMAPNYSDTLKAGQIDYYCKDVNNLYDEELNVQGKVWLSQANIKELTKFVEKVVKCFENLFV